MLAWAVGGVPSAHTDHRQLHPAETGTTAAVSATTMNIATVSTASSHELSVRVGAMHRSDQTAEKSNTRPYRNCRG